MPEAIDFASIDVSFISLSKVLPAVRMLLKGDGEVTALIKPQFEAGREKVGKHGVVRDPAVHTEVIRAAVRYAEETGFSVQGLTYSPIRGPEGNIEYLYDLSLDTISPDRMCAYPDLMPVTEERIAAVVREAHASLVSKKERE